MNTKTSITNMNVFESNALKLRDLNAAIKTTFARRNHSDVRWKEWQQACRKFHDSYDALAFPGGLTAAMALFYRNEPSAIEMVVRFLEADPWYFRSGYHKAAMIHQLRFAPLTEDHRKRLQQVVLARIRADRTPREFRSYCRLARLVSDQDFEIQVASFRKSTSSVQSRHALWVLTYLKSPLLAT